MAKMFYSLEEAAQKLGKSEDEVRQMAQRGEITEFRDGEKLIFKVDQIDLLAGDEGEDMGDMSSMIPLSDTSGGSALAIDLTDSGFGADDTGGGSEPEPAREPASGGGEDDTGGASGSVIGLEESEAGGSAVSLEDGGEDAKEATGISVFDADELDAADPSAVTQVTDSGAGMEGLDIDSMGSGSGLMDLTQESDDTSLGTQGLLDDIFAGDEEPSSESGETMAAEDTGLFEGGPVVADELEEEPGGAGVPVVAAAAEPYDGRGSGLAGGFALGMVVVLAGAMAVVVMKMLGSEVPLGAIPVVGENNLYLTGALAAVVLLPGIIGFLVGGGGGGGSAAAKPKKAKQPKQPKKSKKKNKKSED